MQLKDLKPRQGKVDITVTVIEKSEPRTFSKFNSQGRVCNAKVQDDSGTMTVSLWNEQVDMVNVGDIIAIKNGYVSEWQGEMQLSTGKFGQLEVVGKGSGSPPPSKAAPAPAAAKPVKEATEENFDEPDDELSSDVEEETLD
jgi:replication factor A1